MNQEQSDFVKKWQGPKSEFCDGPAVALTYQYRGATPKAEYLAEQGLFATTSSDIIAPARERASPLII